MVVKTDSPNIYMHTKCFTAEEIDLYMAATSLSLSKTDSLNISRALISFSGGQIRLSETLQAIYTLCGIQHRHSEPLQVFYTL